MFSHGNKEVFSCLGIQLAVNFFLERGHTHITVFVPSWRKEQPRPDVPITGEKVIYVSVMFKSLPASVNVVFFRDEETLWWGVKHRTREQFPLLSFQFFMLAENYKGEPVAQDSNVFLKVGNPPWVFIWGLWRSTSTSEQLFSWPTFEIISWKSFLCGFKHHIKCIADDFVC